MTDLENAQSAEDEELVRRIALTSLRMMAGAVPRDVVDRLHSRMRAEPEYPWEEVVDAVLAEPVAASQLVNKGVLAHRNWLASGGAANPAPAAQAVGGRRRKTLKTRGKTALAMAIVKGGFFILYTVVVILVLVLLRHKWPWMDIYRLLDGLKQLLPGVFGG